MYAVSAINTLQVIKSLWEIDYAPSSDLGIGGDVIG